MVYSEQNTCNLEDYFLESESLIYLDYIATSVKKICSVHLKGYGRTRILNHSGVNNMGW